MKMSTQIFSSQPKRKSRKANFMRSVIGLMLLSGLLIWLASLLTASKKTRSLKRMTTQLFEIFTLRLGLPAETARTFIAQAAHETGYFSSNVFKNANNLFGIKAHGRTVTGKIENTDFHGYAVYENIEGSCNDAVNLARRRDTLKAAGSVYTWVIALKMSNYFEAPVTEYLNGMLAAYKKLFPEHAHKYNQ